MVGKSLATERVLGLGSSENSPWRELLHSRKFGPVGQLGRKKGEAVRRVSAVVFALVLGITLLPGAVAIANHDTDSYVLHIEDPNSAEAPNGQQISVDCPDTETGCGTFQVHPKGLGPAPTGSYTSSNPSLGTGSWVATELLSFQSYGCGVVLGFDIPDNLCGGELRLRVTLTNSASQQFQGVLSIFCIIGENPPNSHDEPSEEGINLDVRGVANFNEIVPGGTNVYDQQS